MAELGYVGLGVMGGRMAKRLLDAGHRVTGFNRTRSKAEWLIEAGMAWADSPREVAEAAEITFSMVTDTKALRAIVEGPDGIMSNGKLLSSSVLRFKILGLSDHNGLVAKLRFTASH